jgi:predicted transcriptional regulator/predicted ArsR family transcriptional regulator
MAKRHRTVLPLTRPYKNVSAVGFGGKRPINTHHLQDAEIRRKVQPGFPVEQPFTSQEQIDKYLGGDRMLCLLCGRSLKVLATHLTTIHGTNVEAYKEKYGLPAGRGLTCESSSQAYSDHITGVLQTTDLKQKMRAAAIRSRTAAKNHGGPKRPRRLTAIQRDRQRARMQTITGMRTLTVADADAFFGRLKQGRSATSVGQDPDMPSSAWWEDWLANHPEWRQKVADIQEHFDFATQARLHTLGQKFTDAITAKLKSGLSCEQTAEALGVTGVTVSNHMRKIGLEAELAIYWETLPFPEQARLNRLGPRFDAAVKSLVVDQGLSVNAAEKQLGVSFMAIKRHLEAMGYAFNDARHKKERTKGYYASLAARNENDWARIRETFLTILAEVGKHRTIDEVLKDPGMPSRGAWFNWLKAKPAWKAEFLTLIETLPFRIQARMRGLGTRFTNEVRALHESGLDFDQIAARLGVCAASCKNYFIGRNQKGRRQSRKNVE